MRPRTRPLALTLGLLLACDAPRTAPSSATTAPVALTSASGEGQGTSTGEADGSGTTTGAFSTGSTTHEPAERPQIWDLGDDPDLGDGKPPGCKGKIDFLFVISRYAGMEGFQTQLLDAFPKFIDTIQAKFADFDYHIMVVDGDHTWGLSICDAQCPLQCDEISNYPCDHQPTYCDAKIGAGVVFPAGDDAANKFCNIDDGRRYMVTGQSNLKETFACVAQVGSSGGDWIGEALTAAVHSNINDPGGCNPGFLRKDALLMVTLISNTYDSPNKPFGSTGDPKTWTEAVRKAKGDLESVVLLNIGSNTNPDCHEKDRLCQMLKLFPYAMDTEIWSDDYGPYFDQATNLVEVACAGFAPPG